MSAVGGSIESVSIDGRTFPVAADAEANQKLGGFEKEQQPNGDGSARAVLTRVTWLLDGLTVQIDPDRADQEFLQEQSDSKKNVNIVVTYASGVSYQGRGSVTGEVSVSSQSATAGITLAGPGKLSQQ